ncbi:hypothetical protein OAT48_02000 [Gammaproteobacteria bacterium]|nr:hypothetical protein [Gammaproteobacteria bacterium]
MKGCLTVIGGGFLILVLLAAIGGSDSNSSSSARTAADKINGSDSSSSSSAKTAADKIKGFHCLSAWDGSHTDLKYSVKAVLRNSASFKHVATEIGPLFDGNHLLSMRYQAQNGFGGTNVEFATGTISNSSCELLEWSVN